ncbi:MAG: gephyrin-like molybdotransferase Glp [Anaerolineales bacterium]
MSEFLTLIPPAKARELFLRELKNAVQLSTEWVQTTEAIGRVSAKQVEAPHPLPAFTRATVDGYALSAMDTFGASESLPAYFKIVGEVKMGEVAHYHLLPMQAVLIHTGGMLPDNSDAVVMIEHTQKIAPDEIEVYKSVSTWENTIIQGEEIQTGECVISQGKKIRAVEMGGLLALGITQIEVFRKPRVGIISSGDEVVPPHNEIKPGQVRDVNSYTLSSLVKSCGGDPILYGIIQDDENQLRYAIGELKSRVDLILISAGSSVSTRDYTARVIQEQGEPGVLVHGLNTRPGKPTILALSGNIPIIGLPGNPLSAYVIALHLVKPVVELLQGNISPTPPHTLQAKLSINLSSQAGREDWIPAKLIASPQGWLVEPIFGKSNMIFALARADGLIFIPEDYTGYSANEMVTVELLDD